MDQTGIRLGEPDRHYFYRFATNCKKFKYTLYVPPKLQMNPKVVTVDVESGEKRYATKPATVNYLEDKTKVTWEATNLYTMLIDLTGENKGLQVPVPERE
jgi:hypothetical protein